ncbi:MAG: MBOAT family protein [Deltaproteobacteria bacterium]|nr:MBOAT family protein [Deltaproteobacteria bacterium]
MLFNSRTFLAFFAIVLPAYLALTGRRRAQNVLLLLASLVFYGFWDYRFLGLLALSSGVDFITAQKIRDTDSPRRKKLFLVVSLVMNLAVLGFFKYANFFAASTVALLGFVGVTVPPLALSIALPVGISFYTFQAMSYCIDVYRGDLEPTRSPLDYALFIAFFPHLVAGPIQRPVVLLPQMAKDRTIAWSEVNAGLFLIVWGYLKKVVIADNMARIANPIFDGWQSQAGLDIVVGALAFTFQIYGDFSGYSDIARGLSKLMGFELLLNFRLPYFALNPTDFWLRWHVSLSTWLRDYLYIPLGGNRGSQLATYRNLFMTMLLGGLWHGAAWNFVLWGAYHGGLLVAYRLLDRDPEHEDPWSGRFSTARILAKMLLMFAFTVVGWVIFRSRSAGQAFGMLARMGFTTSSATRDLFGLFGFFVTPLVAMQIWQYRAKDLLVLTRARPWLCGLAYGAMLVAILVFGVRDSVEFIYFQF